MKMQSGFSGPAKFLFSLAFVIVFAWGYFGYFILCPAANFFCQLSPFNFFNKIKGGFRAMGSLMNWDN